MAIGLVSVALHPLQRRTSTPSFLQEAAVFTVQLPNVWLVWDGLVGAVVGAVVGVLEGAVVGVVVSVLAGALVGEVVGVSMLWVVEVVASLLSAGSFLQAVIDTTSNKARITHRILFINSVHSVLVFDVNKIQKIIDILHYINTDWHCLQVPLRRVQMLRVGLTIAYVDVRMYILSNRTDNCLRCLL